jgi:excisionase family DNA binding protein
MSERKVSSGKFLSPREFAELLGLNRESVYRALARSELQAVRVGRSLRLPRAQIGALLAGGDCDADNQAERDDF